MENSWCDLTAASRTAAVALCVLESLLCATRAGWFGCAFTVGTDQGWAGWDGCTVSQILQGGEAVLMAQSSLGSCSSSKRQLATPGSQCMSAACCACWIRQVV